MARMFWYKFCTRNRKVLPFLFELCYPHIIIIIIIIIIFFFLLLLSSWSCSSSSPSSSSFQVLQSAVELGFQYNLLPFPTLSALCPSDLYFIRWFSLFGAAAPKWNRASPFTRFLDHTRRNTVGRTPLDGWLVRRRDIYLTTHTTHNRQTFIPQVGFELATSAGERPLGPAYPLFSCW